MPNRKTSWAACLAATSALLFGAASVHAEGSLEVSLAPIVETPGWWQLDDPRGQHWYVLPGVGCPDAHGGTVELVADDQGVPWLVFADVGEQCPISQQVEAQ
jgi:hypothetical protein